MPVVAGVWAAAGNDALHGLLREMLSIQAGSSHKSNCRVIAHRSFAAGVLFEESTAQRAVLTDGALSMVVDARVDNSDELQERLGLRGPASDAALIFAAYRKWGTAAVDHLVGDFAFAVWEHANRVLTLARDVTGQRPLHFYQADGVVAFASLPSGLTAESLASGAVDKEALAEFVADLPRTSRRTFHRDIQRVLPGETITFTGGEPKFRRYFEMPQGEVKLASDFEYEEALREHLDNAVSSRIRNAGRIVAAQLSGGLDSGAVAATAARAAAAEQIVLAFTAAPAPEFSGAAPQDRIADESSLAASVAAMYPNVRHAVVRERKLSTLRLLERDACFFEEPIGHLCNQVWWSEILDRAQAAGATVLLTGEAGNLAMTAGGYSTLAELLRRGRWRQWASTASSMIWRSRKPRPVLAASFRPWITPPMPRALADTACEKLPFLDTKWKRALGQRIAEQRGSFDVRGDILGRWETLVPADPGCFRKKVFMRWGIDELDPTADRRLLEFCFSLPPEQLLRRGLTRSLARRAFEDRLPPLVLSGPRGYQAADWHLDLTPGALVTAVESYSASKVTNYRSMRATVERWPADRFAEMGIIAHNRMGFLRALSASAFEVRRSQSCDDSGCRE